MHPVRSMVRMLRATVAVVVLLATTYAAQSQQAILLDVDTTAFPFMQGRFFATDELGRPQYPKTTEMSIYENGVRQIIDRITCSDTTTSTALSAVLVMDVSTSMRGANLDEAQEGARAWIKGLSMTGSECALVSAGDGIHIVQDLTSDTGKLMAAIDALSPRGVMDHNAALLHPVGGSFAAVARGTNKRVIVLLTDGPAPEMLSDEILAEAERLNCTISVVVLGLPASPALRRIAERTGGLVVDDVATTDQAIKAYRSILSVMQRPVPCVATWRSSPSCGTADRVVDLLWMGDTSRTTIHLHSDRKARLEFSPNHLTMLKPRLGDVVSRKILVTARNAAFTVDGIVPSDDAFAMTPSRFTLADGESIELTVHYPVRDSALRNCVFAFRNDVCPQQFYVAAGYIARVPSSTTLRVTHPNRGERFGAGDDVEIRWEGIPADDSVQIDYSTNDGTSWVTVTKNATGLRYLWRDVPRITGTTARIRIAHGTYPQGFDPQLPPPQVMWQYTVDKPWCEANSLTQLADGAFAATGSLDLSERTVIATFKYDRQQNRVVWFSEQYHSNYASAMGRSIRQRPDGTLEVVGYAEDIYTYRCDCQTITINNKKQRAHLRLRPDDGALIRSDYSGGSENEEIADFCFTQDSGDARACTDYMSGTKSLDLCVRTKTFQRCYGGAGRDYAHSIIQLRDSSLVVVGGLSSVDVSPEYHGGEDVWIIKLDDKTGDILWQRSLGGSGLEDGRSVIELDDGSLVVAGWTSSTDGDVSRNQGLTDVWIMKLDPNDGTLIWQRTLGGSNNDYAQSVIQSADGMLVVAANTSSSDGDVPGYSGGDDAWMLKLSADDGSIVWSKTIGTSSAEKVNDLVQAKDGSYVTIGGSRSGPTITAIHDGFVGQYDDSDTSFIVVSTDVLSRNVDMKHCVVGSVRDSVIAGAVRNTGSYPATIREIRFAGSDAAAFTVVSHGTPFRLLPGDIARTEIRFRPTRAGYHSAGMLIFSGSDTLVQKIEGVGVEAVLASEHADVDFGTADLGEERDTVTTVSLASLSALSYQVTGVRIVGQHSKSFSIVRGGGSFMIERDVPHELALRFRPRSSGRVGATLELLGKDDVKIADIQLYGEGVGAGVIDTIATTVVMRDVEASVGQQATIRMDLTDSENLDRLAAATNYTATIAFNPTVVRIADASYQCTEINPSLCHLTVIGTRGDDSALLSIPVMVTLGTTDRSPLQIVSFQWIDAGLPTSVTTVDGTVHVTDICEEGGTRLFIPSDGRFSLTCRPNPAETAVELRYGVAEVAPVTIDVVDRTGRTILTPVLNPRLQPGVYATLVDVRLLSAGPYVVVLRSPNAVLSTRLDIAR